MSFCSFELWFDICLLLIGIFVDSPHPWFQYFRLRVCMSLLRKLPRGCSVALEYICLLFPLFESMINSTVKYIEGFELTYWLAMKIGTFTDLSMVRRKMRTCIHLCIVLFKWYIFVHLDLYMYLCPAVIYPCVYMFINFLYMHEFVSRIYFANQEFHEIDNSIFLLQFMWELVVPFSPIFHREYGEFLIRCGLMGEAVKIFEDLELWDNLIYCYRYDTMAIAKKWVF